MDITLHSTKGGSDKLYQLTVVAAGTLYNVHYGNGKRTSGLTPGKKPKNGIPLSLAEAEALATKTETAKRADGYHDLGGCSLCANEEGAVIAPLTPAVGDSNIETCHGGIFATASKARDFSPQLLTEIDGAEAATRILLQPQIAMQQKFDGKRIRLLVEGRSVTAYNRDGEACGISSEIMRDARRLAEVGPVMLDGEDVRGVFYAFDLLEVCGQDIKGLAFRNRENQMTAIVNASKAATLKAARTEYGRAGKIAMMQRVEELGLEGVVGKQADSPYIGGRRSDQYKYKLVTSASFVVLNLNYLKATKAKNSVDVGVFDEKGQVVECGSVTIRNGMFRQTLKLGSVVEVKYLHAFPESRHIYQPRMLAVRDDVHPQACLLSQLRFKGEAVAV